MPVLFRLLLCSLLVCFVFCQQPQLNLTSDYKFQYVTQNLPARKQWVCHVSIMGETQHEKHGPIVLYFPIYFPI